MGTADNSLQRAVRRGAHDAESAREHGRTPLGAEPLRGGTRGMPEPHSLARPEAYRRGARSVKIWTYRWGSHGPVAGRRAHKTIPRQLCDDGPHTARVDSIKLTNTGVRPELANLQMPGHAHRFDMPSAELRRCNALWLTNIVGGGSFATRVVALATAPGWSRCSHRQLGNDRGGKQ
jgi:hypothetical protein